MPQTRPTLSELIERASSNLISRITGLSAILRKSVLRVLGIVLGGLMHELYGFAVDIAKQLFVKSAEDQYLEMHADEWGVTRKAATYAAGNISFTGTNGIEIPAGTVVQNTDGDQYATDALATISSGWVMVAVTALTAGADSNMVWNEKLDLVSPITGVDNEAIVNQSGIAGGADRESDDAVRARVLDIKRLPAVGGNLNDYIVWTKETPNLQPTRVWPFENYNSNGSIGIFFVLDNEPSIIPSTANVAAVQRYLGGWSDTGNTTSGTNSITGLSNTSGIEAGDKVKVSAGFPSANRLYTVTAKTTSSITLDINASATVSGVTITAANGKAPSGAHPKVYAPTSKPTWFSVSLAPNNATVQAAVESSLAALFIREATVEGVIKISHIREAISVATGETDHALTNVWVDGVQKSVADISYGPGELPVFDAGNMNYSSL